MNCRGNLFKGSLVWLVLQGRCLGMFSPASLEKISHNLAIIGPIEKWFLPSCSLRDSASNDISVIAFKNMAVK